MMMMMMMMMMMLLLLCVVDSLCPVRSTKSALQACRVEPL